MGIIITIFIAIARLLWAVLSTTIGKIVLMMIAVMVAIKTGDYATVAIIGASLALGAYALGRGDNLERNEPKPIDLIIGVISAVVIVSSVVIDYRNGISETGVYVIASIITFVIIKQTKRK